MPNGSSHLSCGVLCVASVSYFFQWGCYRLQLIGRRQRTIVASSWSRVRSVRLFRNLLCVGGVVDELCCVETKEGSSEKLNNAGKAKISHITFISHCFVRSGWARFQLAEFVLVYNKHQRFFPSSDCSSPDEYYYDCICLLLAMIL